VIIETRIRKKLTKNEITFRKAHNQLNAYYNKNSFVKRILLTIWSIIPLKIEKIIWLNAAQIPVIKKQTTESFCRKHGIPVFKVNKHSSRECKEILEHNNID